MEGGGAYSGIGVLFDTSVCILQRICSVAMLFFPSTKDELSLRQAHDAAHDAF